MKMIEVVAPFKHGGQQFFEGERRMVEDADADYFCQHGWAKREGEAAKPLQPGAAKLEVQNGKHATKGEVK